LFRSQDLDLHHLAQAAIRRTGHARRKVEPLEASPTAGTATPPGQQSSEPGDFAFQTPSRCRNTTSVRSRGSIVRGSDILVSIVGAVCDRGPFLKTRAVCGAVKKKRPARITPSLAKEGWTRHQRFC